MLPALSEFTVPALADQLAAWGYKPGHAAAILREFYSGGGRIAPRGRKLPGGLLETFRAELPLASGREAVRQVAADGTTKLLRQLHDGRTVEAVLMPDFDPGRAAGCLSSQVGCAMGCDFCATTKTGFERNLTSGEIVEQFLALRAAASATGRRLRTVVFMGMGEPMLNLDAVVAAVARIADNAIGGLGWRQVTVSTVGIVPGIHALIATRLNVNLAVSLHAPDDDTRAQLLPAGRRYPIAEVLAAADAFQAAHGRPVTIQYCLLGGLNDSVDHARLLAERVGRRRMHVNVLDYNPTGPSLRGRIYERSAPAAKEAFLAALRERGIVTHARRSRGCDIDAACGQLRRRATEAGAIGDPRCAGERATDPKETADKR